MVKQALAMYIGESKIFTFDFTQEPQILAGETIVSVTSVNASPSGLTVGTGTASGGFVNVRLSGGTVSTTYTVVCTFLTSAANTLVGVGDLYIMPTT